MKIEMIIEFLFFIFFLVVILFIILGFISIMEIANYFIGEDVTRETRVTVYTIIGAVCLFVLNYLAKKARNMNKLI